MTIFDVVEKKESKDLPQMNGHIKDKDPDSQNIDYRDRTEYPCEGLGRCIQEILVWPRRILEPGYLVREVKNNLQEHHARAWTYAIIGDSTKLAAIGLIGYEVYRNLIR